MKKYSRAYSACAATLSVIFAVSIISWHHAAYADTVEEYTSTVSDLRKSYGYAYSYAELDAQITEAAESTRMSKLEIAQSTLESARKYETHDDASLSDRAANSSRHNNLANAQNIGDVFVSEGNNTLGWNHGHTGIFTNSTTVVEAVGPGSGARSVGRSGTLAAGKAFLQHVRAAQSNRNKAAERAKTYIGRGYNANVVNTNKNDWGGLNCGQLVWASYMYGSSIDLAPHDNYVYPYTIRDSAMTVTYQTINA